MATRLDARAGTGRFTGARARVEKRNHVGTISLLVALGGAVASRIGLLTGPFAGATWLQVVAAGFEAGVVGGLADWFAVTALFRHPLGLPVPHTAIIPARRAKIVDGIVSMVQDEWLSPEVIGSRLQKLAPSTIVLDWLSSPEHLGRIGAPLRDLLSAFARMLTEPEVVELVDRALQRQLRGLPVNAAAGRWLLRMVESDNAAAAFQSLALSLANFLRRPDMAERLQRWLDRTARQLHREGQRLIPLILRRKVVQRKIVETACEYATAELSGAAADPGHRLRGLVFGAVRRFAERLAAGDPQASAQVERLRAAVVESLEARPIVLGILTRVREQLSADLAAPDGYLAGLVDREIQQGVRELLDDPERRAAFDRWVRTTVDDLLRRHHHQIGLTVRENLESLDTAALVKQIEDRVGADLQFIRLNGALVGGIIGVLLAILHRAIG